MHQVGWPLEQAAVPAGLARGFWEDVASVPMRVPRASCAETGKVTYTANLTNAKALSLR